MPNRIYRSITEPIRENLTRSQQWDGPDRGLITCWETGREFKESKPDLAEKVSNGELPVMGWKGGINKKINGKKYGTFYYLAQWQGMRGDNLDIDTSQEYILTCTRTGMSVIFRPFKPKRAPSSAAIY